MTLGPHNLLQAAKVVATKDEGVLANRWQVTSAALARQAIELAVADWLGEHDVHVDRNHKVEFLCLESLHPNTALAAELHHVWCRLSEVCHAMSYDMPPTEQQLQQWWAVVETFLDASS